MYRIVSCREFLSYQLHWFLSPRPGDLKDWHDKNSENGLMEFGTFPWYPTTLVVAANTVIEVRPALAPCPSSQC